VRIGVQTWGSDGDVYPFAALAAGLAARGHEVTLAITAGERKDYAALGARFGFRVRAAGYIGRDLADLDRAARELFSSGNPVRQMSLLFRRMFEPGVDDLFASAEELCAASDAVVGHFILHPLRAAAELSGTPAATVALNPGGIPSRHAPPFGVPDLGASWNRVAWRISELVLNRIILPSVNRLRRRVGLPPQASYRQSWESARCSLVAVSPALCPPPPDWTGRHLVTGFLRLPGGLAREPLPAPLERFLAAGPPPVYLTFGSMLTNVADPVFLSDSVRLLLGAARAAGCRAIVQAPWDRVPPERDEEGIMRVGPVDHRAVFPRCSAVVHHGGAGTTQTAALCGRPSVVVPHVLDQYLWAGVLRRRGVAAPMIDRRRATATRVARALRRVLDDRGMAARARSLGEEVAAEDGVGAAARAIEKAFGVRAAGPRGRPG